LGARQLLLDGGFKINHNTAGGETITRFPGFDGTTACRQDDALLLGQFVNDFFFAIAKASFAFDIKNPAHIRSGASLNFLIGIEELHVELLSQLTANSAFAGTHRPNQKDIAFLCHFVGITKNSLMIPRVQHLLAGQELRPHER